LGTLWSLIGLSITLRSAGLSFQLHRPFARSSRFRLKASTHWPIIEASVTPGLRLPLRSRYSGICVTRDALNRSWSWLSESWHIKPASNRRPSSLIVGLLRPSCAVRLFRRSASQSCAASGVPTRFHSFFPSHFSRFIFAVVLLVNQPPPPKVAPTSCTSMNDLSQTVVKGFVLSLTSILSQSRRCCGGLLSLCCRNAPSSFKPSFS